MDGGAVERRWEREQAILGLARDTPDEAFARGGLAVFAVNPTVRIVVLPGDPSAQRVPAESPETVMPKVITLPFGGQLPSHGTVRGTSSGYVGFTSGSGGQWRSFDALLWHGDVDVFLGAEGGRTSEISPGSRRRVIFLRMYAERHSVTGAEGVPQAERQFAWEERLADERDVGDRGAQQEEDPEPGRQGHRLHRHRHQRPAWDRGRPDGALWFTNSGGTGSIGRISTAGKVTN